MARRSRLPSIYYSRRGRRDGAEFYYAYLDSRDRRLIAPLEGPSGTPLSLAIMQPGEMSGRLRLSVIRRTDFLAIAPQFEPIPLTGATPVQRAARRAALAEFLDPTPVEIMDIHVPTTHPERRLLREPAVGGWHLVAVTEGRRLAGAPVVVVGDPDVGGDDRLSALWLLRGVTVAELAALRRVFSLAHIGDAGDEGGREGDPDPLPRPPMPWPAPEPGAPPRLRVIRVLAEADESIHFVEEVAQAGDAYTVWREAQEETPLQQHIHLSED